MYIIKKASINDLEKILKIVDSVLLDNLVSKNNGFLTSNRGKKFYKKLIEKTNFFYIVREKNSIIGFLIAYPNTVLDSDDDIQRYFINNYQKENFIYIFQVAVSPKYQSKGIGKQLYKRLFKDTDRIKKIVVTSSAPYNQSSEKFHLKLGFKKIGKIIRDDGGSNFIYENIENTIY